MRLQQTLGMLICSIAMLGTSGAAMDRIGPGGAKPGSSETLDEKEPQRWVRDCDFVLQLAGGEARLSRTYTEEGELDGGDFFHWNPKGYDPAKRAKPIDIALSYIWIIDDEAQVNPREIGVKVNLTTEQPLPEVSDFRIQRPFPIQPYGIIGSTALSTQIFPYSPYEYNKTNGHGEMPLGDLLAYGEGFDELSWTLVSGSNVLGGNKTLAQGTLALGPLREAMEALPRLRKGLAKMARNPVINCERRQDFAPPPHL